MINQRQVLYIESYDTGSHARTLDLFLQFSRHNLLPVRIPPSHWKWTTGAVHHVIESNLPPSPESLNPEVIVLSGPMSVPAVLMTLPARWRGLPVAYLFHESQWTYPTNDVAIEHYLLGHLDVFRFVDQCWFNSNFHRTAFWDAAHRHSSRRIRRLARTVLAGRREDTKIIYPPVDELVGHNGVSSSPCVPRILWCARWEPEKRPDRFVRAINNLDSTEIRFELAILGPGSGPDPHTDTLFRAIESHVAVRGPLADRAEYENELRRSDIVVSTTDHEFFGIAVVEAAMAGAIPILPNAHAYPETLPSAVFYEAGNIDALTNHLTRVIERQWGSIRPWVHDARRFLPARTVTVFDEAVEELSKDNRVIRETD